jgi:hypothetical protein
MQLIHTPSFSKFKAYFIFFDGGFDQELRMQHVTYVIEIIITSKVLLNMNKVHFNRLIVGQSKKKYALYFETEGVPF